MAVQPASQQGLLRELAAGGDEARVRPSSPAVPAPAPRQTHSLDLLDLLLGLPALLLQDLPLRLAGRPALFLLQVLQPAGRGRGPGSLTATHTHCGGLWGSLRIPAGLVAPHDAARWRGTQPRGLGSGLGGAGSPRDSGGPLQLSLRPWQWLARPCICCRRWPPHLRAHCPRSQPSAHRWPGPRAQERGQTAGSEARDDTLGL